MEELLPGLHHWTAWRETIGAEVHSAYVAPSRTLIDPMLPPEGLDALAALGAGPPERILLTNRHHLRDSAAFVEAFGCTVACHEAGLWDLTDQPTAVQGFRFGEEVAPGIVAREVAVLCPEETALHVQLGPGVLAFADAVVRREHGELAFVPDHLLGEDPPAIRAGLSAAFARLVEQVEFDALLLAHGAPQARGGRRSLRAFAAAHAGA